MCINDLYMKTKEFDDGVSFLNPKFTAHIMQVPVFKDRHQKVLYVFTCVLKNLKTVELRAHPTYPSVAVGS